MIKSIQRVVVILIVGWLSQNTSLAQQYNFSASSGTFMPVFMGTPIDAVETDEGSAVIPIGFTFTYFGVNYAQAKIFSNGLVSFDLMASPSSFNSIETENRRVVAPLWDDLQGFGGSASYIVTGTAGSRVLTIEWRNWRWSYAATSENISFQVKLFESTNVIQFVYRQEAGAISVGSGASIGITGSTSGVFYSLADVSASPALAISGNNNIITRPATGQQYTFTPNSATVVAPTTLATNVSVSNTTSTTLDIGWTNGNGAYRMVAVKQTAAAESVIASNNTLYNASSIFQNGSSLGNGWYCVYNGNGSAVQVTGLQSGHSYRIQVIEYNGLAGQQKYTTTTNASNPITATTTLIAPGPGTSYATPIHTSGTSATFDVIEVSGTRRAVFMKATNTGTAPVVNNTTYTANPVFGSGTQVGTSGWFCVANAALLGMVTVTGLTPNTNYLVHVVDYNGPDGNQLYSLLQATTNPLQVATTTSTVGYAYTFAASTGVFQPINGVALNNIEVDDALSDEIPIGFSFMLGGISYNSLIASSNGFISFNPKAPALGSGTFNQLSSSFARPVIAPLWDDVSGSGGEASYTTTGTAPNRIFVIQYLNWRWSYSAPTAVISFQIALHEQSQKITYTYQSETGAPDFADASIGIAFNETGKFISLNNTSAAPVASTTTETTNIATKPATGQVYSFTPVPVDQTVTFNSISNKVFGNAPFSLTATASSGLPVTFSSSDPALASVSGSIVTIHGAGGPVTITASQAGNGAYNVAATVTQSFTIAKANQIITFSKPSDKSYGEDDFDLAGSASSGLAVSYVSSNPSVASISGKKVTILSPGSTNITASQSGNANYNAAPDVTQALVVNKASQTITFNPLPLKMKSDPSFTLAGTSTSGLALSYSSSNSSVATINGSVVTIVGTGTTTITASQAGNTYYHPATSKVQELVVKEPQTITFASLSEKTFGDADFTLTATASSSLPVTYTSSENTVAIVTGNTVQIVSAGTTTITATQAGNGTYTEAPPVSQTLVVKKSDQTITLSAIPDKTVSSVPFEIVGNSSSGLSLTFTAGNKLTIVGSLATTVAAGKETITASQSGDANYNAAAPVSISFCINPPKPVITVVTPSPSTFQLTSSAQSGNQWYRDGTAINGATEKTISAIESGIYTVVATTDGCSSVPSEEKVILITGLESRNAEIRAYPNPVEDELVIEFTGSLRSIPSTVKLYDMNGKQVESANGTGKVLLNTAFYAPGNYLLVIESGNQIISGRILKK